MVCVDTSNYYYWLVGFNGKIWENMGKYGEIYIYMYIHIVILIIIIIGYNIYIYIWLVVSTYPSEKYV